MLVACGTSYHAAMIGRVFQNPFSGTAPSMTVAENLALAARRGLGRGLGSLLPARLRPKFDSIDVVQSVWVDVVQGLRTSQWQFNSAAELRAFLVKVTRNRFIDHVRRHRHPLTRERPLARVQPHELPASPDPRPSEVARAEELWEQMLASCPPGHRDVLRLKRQGLALADIAARTGLHPSSVRRILYDLARRMADREKRRQGSEVPGP